MAWCSQNCKDAWVWMVEGHCVHGVELAEIVPVWIIVSVPGYYIKWRVSNCALEHLSLELVENLGSEFNRSCLL